MKKMKRFVALALSVVMVLAMSVMAFADSNDATININGGDKDSEYAAYRLLNLTTSTTGEEGSTTTNYAYTLNAKYETILKNVSGKETEKEIVEYISGLDASETRTFADSVYAAITANSAITADATTKNDKFENIPQGYYLIAETKVGTASGGQTGSTSLVMLNTAGKNALDIYTKEDVPEVEKKVKDTNDSTGTTSEWQDSADADVGDELEYQLTGTVSEKIDSYKEYYYEFVDQMTHLTYVDGSVKVEIVNGDNSVDVTDAFTTTWEAGNKKLSVKCDDLKAINNITLNENTKVVVTYKATLDAGAVVGSTGNPNEVYLKYSNNPYHEGDGTPTGETPKDKNIVFTYKTVINKTDGTNPLAGAEFTLEKFVAAEDGEVTYKGVKGNWVFKSQVETEPGTTFTFSGLDDGYYRLTETKAPDGYNKLTEPIEFTISAKHDTNSADPKLTDLTGEVTSGEAKFTSSTSEGSLTTDVVNKSGSQLPSTGGIGTTIFYIVGGILMVGAAVLLITKRRAEN